MDGAVWQISISSRAGSRVVFFFGDQTERRLGALPILLGCLVGAGVGAGGVGGTKRVRAATILSLSFPRGSGVRVSECQL